jgi:Ribbon-helix-helix domain
VGKTKKHQQVILLEHDKADLLAKLANETRVPRQEYLREAVDMLLKKYYVIRKRAKSGPPRNIHTVRPKPMPKP